LGIMLGRIGNFLNQELYGILVPEHMRWLGAWIVTFLTNLHIFHIYPLVGPELRVNTNFLASLFEWLTLFIIVFSIVCTRIKTKKPQPGKIVATFLIGYSLVRFLLEYIRADSQLEFHGRFSISQRFFLIFFVLGIAVFVWQRKNNIHNRQNNLS
jgi:phosphatidylglycerol:prolipoprotein diacylglycerol transferase